LNPARVEVRAASQPHNDACTQWARLLRLCAPPHVAAERSFVFETAADPLELVERPRLPALAESAPRRQGMGLRF
jgi:hypothetical protein